VKRRLFTILSAGSLLLYVTGCIPIPIPHGSESRNYWEGVAGGPESSARVRVGQSNRASVVKAIGKPDYIDGTGVKLDYSHGEFWEFNHLQLSWLWICIPGPCNRLLDGQYSRDDWLALWFDENGRVRKYAVFAAAQRPPDVAEEEQRWWKVRTTRP